MDIKQITIIPFSPTGTTKQVLTSIAQGIQNTHIEYIDLTIPQQAQQSTHHFSDELVLIGAPVYGGRLPAEAVKRFKQIQADNTLAVIVVVYGNREFEDALLELKQLVLELGFHPVAGGAFIGEHSFATDEFPVAQGRPDNQDLEKALKFAIKIKEKIAALSSPEDLKDLEVPGHIPLKDGMRQLMVSPVSKEEDCTLCGICASVCPTAAISLNNQVTTDLNKCICCAACVKKCPSNARIWENEIIPGIAQRLYTNCSQRKEPQVFGIECQTES